jgi:hypothetical protein
MQLDNSRWEYQKKSSIARSFVMLSSPLQLATAGKTPPQKQRTSAVLPY